MGKKKPTELIPAISPTYLTESILKNPEMRIALPFNKEIFLLKTHIAGVMYVRGIKKMAKQLSEGDELRLVREPKNPYDMWAIVIKNAANRKIGYIPRSRNEIIARLMDGGMRFKAVVDLVQFHAEEDMTEKYALTILVSVYMVV